MSAWNPMTWATRNKTATAQEVQQAVSAQRETKNTLELRLADLQRRRRQAAVLATEGTPQSTPLAVKQCRLSNVRTLDNEIARTAAQIASIEQDLLSLETAVVANTLSTNSLRTANTMSALVNPRAAAETATRLAEARRSVHQVADGFAAVPSSEVPASSIGQLWQQETASVDEVDACLARLSLIEDLDAARTNLAHGFGAASRGQSRSTATGSSPLNSQSQEADPVDDDDDDDDRAIDARIHALMQNSGR